MLPRPVLFIALVVLVAGIGSAQAQRRATTAPSDRQNEDKDTRCRRTANEADSCMQTLLIFGDRSFVPPKGQDQMGDFCRREREAITCVKNYGSDCLAPFPRTLFNIGASGAIKQQKRVCNSKKQSKAFLYHMHCAEVYGMDTSHRCMEAAIIKMEKVAKTAKPEEQIPRACCVFHPLRDCIVNHIIDHCRGITNETLTAKYFDSVLQGAMGDLLDLACGKYSDTESCNQLMPDQMVEYAKLEAAHIKKELNETPKSKSILMPFVQMLSHTV